MGSKPIQVTIIDLTQTCSLSFFKEKVDTMREKNKIHQRKRIYGIHDLLFLPLLVGMAFTKEKETETDKILSEDNREKVATFIEEELVIAEEKIDNLTNKTTNIIEKDEVPSQSETIKQLVTFEVVQEEMDEIEKQLTSLFIEDEYTAEVPQEKVVENNIVLKESSTMRKKESVEDYQDWIEELPIKEKFYDVKVKEMELCYDLKEEVQDIDLPISKEETEKLNNQLEKIKIMLNNQEKKIEQVKIKLAQPITTIEKTRIRLETSSKQIMTNITMYGVISKAKINPLSKIILQTIFLSRAFRGTRRVVTDKVKLPPINYDKVLKSVFYDTKYASSMIDSALYQTKKIMKDMKKEVLNLQDQSSYYDKVLVELQKIENDLKEKKKNIDILQQEVVRAKEKNVQKQKEYKN